MPTFVAGFVSSVAIGTAGSEVDYSNCFDSADLTRGLAKLETTTFGPAGAKTFVPGLIENSFKANARFSQTELTALDALVGVAGKSFIFGPQGTTTGQRKYSALGFVMKIDIKSSVGGLVTADVEFCISGVVTAATF